MRFRRDHFPGLVFFIEFHNHSIGFELLGDIEHWVSEYEKAIEYYAAGYHLAIDSKHINYEHFFCFRLVEMYTSVGNFELAMKYINLNLELLKRRKRDSTHVLLMKAVLHREAGKLEDALELFNRIHSSHLESPRASA